MYSIYLTYELNSINKNWNNWNYDLLRVPFIIIRHDYKSINQLNSINFYKSTFIYVIVKKYSQKMK